MHLEGITVWFNKGTSIETKALDNITLTINAGDFVTIIGSNGAGKTTLLSVISGAVLPSSGNVYLDGKDITRVPEHQRAKWISKIDQDPRQSTAGSLTVEENLAVATLRGHSRGLGWGVTRSRREMYHTLLSTLGIGLEEKLAVRTDHLSGGQRQALAMLMATLVTPRLLLLDEHTAALDPRAASLVMQITGDLVRERNLTTIMVTHNMDQALRWGNRLLMMHRGRIILDLQGPNRERPTVEDLVHLFHKTSGERFADDTALLTD